MQVYKRIGGIEAPVRFTMTDENILANRVVETIASWEYIRVKQFPHDVKTFQLGPCEIGHIHPDGFIDIVFPRPLRNQLIREERAKPHHIYPRSEWISLDLNSESDIENILWVLRLSYLYHMAHIQQLPASRRWHITPIDIESELVVLSPSTYFRQLFDQYI